jgi:antitoxin VapB
MSMNIKNEETHRLAKELAELTGESVTEAVTVAVKERLQHLKKGREIEGRVQAMLAIAKETAPHFRPGFTSTDIGDLLYDERGLPR